MSNVTSFDGFIKDRASANATEVRAYLKKFGVSLAKYTVSSDCKVHDSLCAVVAGWDLFIGLDVMTDYWLRSTVPVFKLDGDTVWLRFASGFGEPVDGIYPYALEIDVERITEGRGDPLIDTARIFERTLREHNPGVLVASVLAIAIMRYANRDSGHLYRMHTADDNLITLVTENQSERMTFRLDIELTRKALQKLKIDCERQDRRDGTEHDSSVWEIFNDQRLEDKE
jgi:hypothetical protein